MNSLNSVLLEGEVLEDPVVKNTPHGTPVSFFHVHHHRTFKNDDGSFTTEGYVTRVEAWSRLGESCAQHLSGKSGCGVRIVGRLTSNVVTDENGARRYWASIIAEHVEFKELPLSTGETA